MLLCELLARVRVLRCEAWCGAGVAGVVEDRQDWQVPHLPARLLEPQAEIRLFAVQEETLVEQPDACQRVASKDEEGAGDPVAKLFRLVCGDVVFALAEPSRPDWPALSPQTLCEGSKRIREPADGRGDVSTGSHLTDSRGARRRSRVESGDERARVAVKKLRVDVEQKGVARVAGDEPLVVRVRDGDFRSELRGLEGTPLRPTPTCRRRSC